MGLFLCCLFGGFFGLHKFVEGKVGMGILYLCTGGLCGIGWLIDIIITLVKWLSKPKPVKQVKAPEPVVKTVKPESPYIIFTFTVAGVTFKNGRKTRQAILRALKWEDEIIETIDLEQYEYEGKPAVYVKINDQVIGNIPADKVETFLEYEEKHDRYNITCDVYGGNKLNDGSRTNYGCEVTIRYKKDA